MTQNSGFEPEEESAFGIPETVDWENTGFEDEDRSSRPTHPKKQAAPRPVQTPTQPQSQTIPTGMPTRPTPNIPQRPHNPNPSQPQPNYVPAQPTPVPVQPTPTPVQPPATQPTYQAPPATQQNPYPNPPQQLPPVISPQPEQTYSTQPAQGYTTPTQASLEDLTEPEWARITPIVAEEPEDNNVFTTDPFEEPLYPTTLTNTPAAYQANQEPVRNPETDDRPVKAPKPKKSFAKKEPTAKDRKTGQYAGGRWKIKILRGMIFTVLGVLILGGFKNVITSDDQPTTSEIAKQVQTKLGYTGFPTDRAEAFAIRFTKEYLTYDQDTEDQRAQRLAIYSPAAASGQWGWDGQGAQSVVSGPDISAPTVVQNKNFATVTVSAQLSTGQWIALAVPVYADSNGALVVSGPPAFVAQPALAQNPGKKYNIDPDDKLDQDISTNLLPGFLEAWASSTQTELERYVTNTATVSARTGLAGTVTYDPNVGSSVEVTMPPGGNTRTGTMEVVWATPSSGSFNQSYILTIKKGPDGRWSVQDIKGGVITDSNEVGGTEGSGATTPTDGPSPVQLNPKNK